MRKHTSNITDFRTQKFSFFLGILMLLVLTGFINGELKQDESEITPIDNTGPIYVLKVEGLIDNGLYRYIRRGISTAESENASGLILHMDTFGGLVDAADKIRKALLDTNIPTVTFIDKNAASAGALISYATDTVFMAPGSSIGAATVVDGGGQKADEKMQSYMRGLMRSTAEATGRNPRIAEAMVDERIEIEGIIAEGSLLTLSSSEALEFEVINGIKRDMGEVFAEMGWQEDQKTLLREETGEQILRFLANPVMSSILMLMMLGGLYFELQSPGVGFAGAMATIGGILFFAPLYIMGFAQPWEIILFFLGVALLVTEIFFLPGFGIPGLIGITLLLVSLFASMVGNVGLSFPGIEYMSTAIWTMAITMILGILMMFSLAKYLPNNRMFRKLVLVDSTSKEAGYISSDNKDRLLGLRGVAVTSLRPSGIALIDNERVDVVSQGDYIENGAPIEVVNTTSSRVMVKRAN